MHVEQITQIVDSVSLINFKYNFAETIHGLSLKKEVDI